MKGQDFKDQRPKPNATPNLPQILARGESSDDPLDRLRGLSGRQLPLTGAFSALLGPQLQRAYGLGYKVTEEMLYDNLRYAIVTMPQEQYQPMRSLAAQQELAAQMLFNQAFTQHPRVYPLLAPGLRDWHRDAFDKRRRDLLKERIQAAGGDAFQVWAEESKPGQTYYEWLDEEGL